MKEAKNQITQRQERREIPRDAPIDWRAPIEHFFIGGTPPPINGKYIDVIDLIKKAQEGNGESLRILLTPMSLQEEKSRLKEVGRKREDIKNEKSNRGAMTIFDIDWQMDLGKKHMFLWTEPSAIDKRGQIKEEWKIWILDTNRETVKNTKLIRGLSLQKNIEQWFSLETVKGKPYKLLKLNIGK